MMNIPGDSSVGRGTCHQARGLEFDPWKPHSRRREPIAASCPLTSTHTLPQHTHAHIRQCNFLKVRVSIARCLGKCLREGRIRDGIL